MDCTAYLLPPDEEDWYGLRIRADIGGGVRRFWLLHDLAHVIAGESAELTREAYDDRYPHFERRADVFAIHGVLSERDRIGDARWIERRIKETVPADVASWQYRVPALAGFFATGEWK